MVDGFVVNGKKFLWNVSANVGVLSPNRQDDVELVQLGYSAMATNPLVEISQEERSVFSAVRLGETCTGREDDPLVRAIRLHQKGRGGPQDGHVSIFRPMPGGLFDGKHSFIINILCNHLSDILPGVYPRLDKHPGCPPILRKVVAAVCTL